MALGSAQLLTEMSTRCISWGKGGRCVRLTTLPPSCAVVMKSGNLNFLEHSGPLQACNGASLPFTSYRHMTSIKKIFLSKNAEDTDKLGYWVTKKKTPRHKVWGGISSTEKWQICWLSDPLFYFRQRPYSWSSLLFSSSVGKPDYSHPYRTEVKNECSYRSFRSLRVQYRIFTFLPLPMGFFFYCCQNGCLTSVGTSIVATIYLQLIQNR